MIHWHPHIHALVSEGVFLPGGTFVPLPKLAIEPFLKLWEQEVFKLLLADGKITEEIVANIRSWQHSGFSMDQSVGLEAEDGEGIRKLIEYFLRCPFSQARMTCLCVARRQVEVTPQGKVIYKTGDLPAPGLRQAGRKDSPALRAMPACRSLGAGRGGNIDPRAADRSRDGGNLKHFEGGQKRGARSGFGKTLRTA